MTDLRTTLHRIADQAEPLPVADDLWRRGRAARRRGQALVVAGVLAVVVSVAWSAALLGGEDREARTASAEQVPAGAIPSRIEDPGELPSEWDLAVGRASVAFFSHSRQAVVVGATDGRYHALDLADLSDATDRGPLALSPDGRLVAWTNRGRIHVVDLVDGTGTDYPANDEHAEVATLAWSPDSAHLLWTGQDSDGEDSGGVVTPSGSSAPPLRPSALLGIPSPTNELVAEDSDGVVEAAPFARRRGTQVERPLPADLYPSGASVRPLGWTQDHLVLAEVDGPSGSYVEGTHLALLTSPDRPESEWTYRIVARDVLGVTSLSVAVDLVPDLDGTSSQQLTHDFHPSSDNPLALAGIEISVLIGLGVAAAIAVLMALRWLVRRLLGR